MTAQFVTTTMLRAVADKLSAKDREFALSMCETVENRNRLSEKQQYWITTLYERASASADKPVNSEVDLGASLAGVIALFDKAAQHLKRPSIVLSVPDLGDIRLSLAGANARCPGTVNVATKAPFGEGTFFGRISRDGKFDMRTPNTVLVNYLLQLAVNPVGVAKEYGRTTGACCFCGIKLTSAASVAVGYGPICAENYGLPWGEEAAA